jgi:hypothetical protein
MQYSCANAKKYKHPTKHVSLWAFNFCNNHLCFCFQNSFERRGCEKEDEWADNFNFGEKRRKKGTLIKLTNSNSVLLKHITGGCWIGNTPPKKAKILISHFLQSKPASGPPVGGSLLIHRLPLPIVGVSLLFQMLRLYPSFMSVDRVIVLLTRLHFPPVHVFRWYSL